jgi:hypothetical protein
VCEWYLEDPVQRHAPGLSFFTSVAYATEYKVISCYTFPGYLHYLGRLGGAPFFIPPDF